MTNSAATRPAPTTKQNHAQNHCGALAASGELRNRLCQKLGLDPDKHAPQTTPDGKFTVEVVECLADCGNAPVVMVNEDLHGRVTANAAERMLTP